MKKLHLYLLLGIGLSVSAVGHATTRYITGDAANPNLSLLTSYDPGTVTINGTFEDDWLFDIDSELGLGAGVSEIKYSLQSIFYDILDSSFQLSLQTNTGSSWGNVVGDTDDSQNAVTFDSLTAGSYRLIVSGKGIGTSGAGKYALSIETEPANGGGVPAVPEPETWSMLLVGTLLLGLQLRRKNAIQNSMLIAA